MATTDTTTDTINDGAGLPVSVVIAAVEEIVRQLAHDADAHQADGFGSPDPDGASPVSAVSGATAADLLAALARLRVVQDQLADWEPLLIGAARDRGARWAAIAPALGVASRQAAERRYLRRNPHSTDRPAMTGEQRVRAARDRRASDRAVAQWARANATVLRQLAGQVTGLSGLDTLDAAAQSAVNRIHHALGNNDTATLLRPLAKAGPYLQRSYPDVAGRIAAIGQTTDRLRQGHSGDRGRSESSRRPEPDTADPP